MWGSNFARFGFRNPQSSAYATFSPTLYIQNQGNQPTFVGGNFWDGRATGHKLGQPSVDQAPESPMTPWEMDFADLQDFQDFTQYSSDPNNREACPVYRVLNPKDRYPVSYQQVWGTDTSNINWPAAIEGLCTVENAKIPLSDTDRNKVETAFNNIALSIVAYESSSEVNQFTSKYDYYLAGKVGLSADENQGLNLFQGKANCASCHLLSPGPNVASPLFTDFKYHNLGVAKNPENPWYKMPPEFNPDGFNFVDLGLGHTLATAEEHQLPDDYKQYADANMGKMQTPTLRNVDKRPSPDFVKAYMHNGYFKSLKSVVHFYNTRDILPACSNSFTTEAQALAQKCWPAPEVAANVNHNQLGNLNLSDAEENQVVAFLKTLSDGYQP
jgi:cytochrome c peroxidase